LIITPPLTILFVRFAVSENGATAIEYSIIAAGVAMAIAATVWTMGPKLNDSYKGVSDAFN
jgi:pilus assembly protein Flp/PilA